jgi:aminoglycoside phosphotransferase (APT) family kinase protein
MPDTLPIADVVETVMRLKPGWNPRAVEVVGALPAGLSNSNYAIRHGRVRYVVRVARDGIPGAIDRRAEYALLCDRVAPLTAPLVAYCLPEGHLLTRFVEGPLLVDTPVDPASIAAYVAALHGRLRPFGWTHPLPALIHGWLSMARGAGASIPQAWYDALDSLRTPARPAPSHNDLNPWNVIVRGAAPRDWCTLDWEWCGDHTPLFDAVALCEGLDLPEAATREVLDRYRRLRDAERVDAVTLDEMRLRFHLREGAWAFAARARFGARPELDHQIARSQVALARLIGQ